MLVYEHHCSCLMVLFNFLSSWAWDWTLPLWFAYCNLIFSSLLLENWLKKHFWNVAKIKYGFVELVVIFFTLIQDARWCTCTNIQSLTRFKLGVWQTSKPVYIELVYKEKLLENFNICFVFKKKYLSIFLVYLAFMSLIPIWSHSEVSI